MNDKCSVEVGDWVRWMWNGQLIVGEVRYVRLARSYPWGFELVTDRGTVLETSVLESRRPIVGDR